MEYIKFDAQQVEKVGRITKNNLRDTYFAMSTLVSPGGVYRAQDPAHRKGTNRATE